MRNILIIEDDQDLCEGLAFFLKMEYERVTMVYTKQDGLKRVEENTYDLVLLDCNLPDGDGFEFCKEIRIFSEVPIIMLTARDTEMDEIKALQCGADDYMRKPFQLAVLKARIDNVLRKTVPLSILEVDGIRLNIETQTVLVDGYERELSTTECKLLKYLLENKGHVLEKDQILEHIWDSHGNFVDENTVSVNIRRLRIKIERDPSKPVYIRTVHGIGYVWRKEQE